MLRSLYLGSRWSSLYGALPRKTAPHRRDSKKQLFYKFKSLLGQSHRSENEVHEFFRQCVLGLKLEHPNSRVEIANTMWDDLKKKGAKMDASLHNSLLRVYISNNHKFSPSQFMDEMSAAGIVPNQSTLNLLLDSHCQQGNLTGAQSVLQHMYDKGHTITEHVYASLITGHTQSGDMDAAWKMLDVMEENGFEPGIPSYTALLQGHANRGEIERVREILKKMIAKKLYPSHDVYIAILDSLSMGGHHSFLNEVLDMIPNKAIVPDLLLLAQSWASREEFESSLQLLEIVSQLSSSGKALQVVPVVFHHIIKSKRPTSWLLETTMRMSNIGCIDKTTWENVLLCMHKSADAACIMHTVQAMHQQGFAVKTHYLLPALYQYANDRDVTGIKSCLSMLTELNLELDSNVVHCIIRVTEPTESIVTIMKECRILDRIEGRRKLISILCHKELYALQDVLKKIDVSEVGEEFLCQCLINHCQNEFPSTTALARTLKMLHTTLPSTSLNNLTSCIQKCADTLSLEGQSDIVRNFAADLIDQGYPLPDDIYSSVMSVAARNTHPSSNELSDEAIRTAITNERHDKVCKLYHLMCEKGYRLNQRDRLAIISSLAHEGHITAAEDLLGELQAERADITRFTWNSLISYYGDRGDTKNARKYYELLVSSGHKPSAFTLCVLMEAYSFHGDVSTVNKLMEDERIRYGLDISNKMFSCLVKVHLNSNDLAGAVAVYEKFPSPVALFLILDAIVAEENDELLERVKEKSLLKSQESSSYDFYQALMLSYIQNGNLDRAREVASEEGFKMNHLSVEAFCRSRVSEGKVDAICSVVQLYDQMGLDTRSLQIYLLKAYIRLGDKEGIQSVQQKMIEFGMRCAASHIITGEPVEEYSSHHSHLSSEVSS